jgi:hypothetical protein
VITEKLVLLGEVAVADVHFVGAAGEAFPVALPAQAGFDKLVADRLADRAGCRGNRRRPIDVDIAGRALHFVRGINRGNCRIGSLARDRADRRARRVVGVRGLRGQIGQAVEIVPVRVVVALDTEVRAADDLEVVAQARVRDCVVVDAKIRKQRIAVRERSVRIVDDLTEAVVLHHDDEHVIELGNSARHRAFARMGDRNAARNSKHCDDLVHGNLRG